MPIDMTAAAYLMESLLKPFGDYAPVVHRLLLDYKIHGVCDCHREILALMPKDATDAALLKKAKEFLVHLKGKKVKLSAVTERYPNGDFRLIYLAPGFMEESIRESGLPVPADMEAFMLAQGWRPVNWDELRRYWKSHK